MGRARELWDELVVLWESGDFARLANMYAIESIYLEPFNPPHNGNLLIEAYLKDFLAGKEELKITQKRVVEDPDGKTLAAEWAFSYTAAGRRWNNLPRATFLEVGDTGQLVYHRDYV